METVTTTNPAPSTSTKTADENVSRHLRALVEEAEALLRSTAQAGDERLDSARHRLQDEVRHLRERVGDIESRAAARLKSAAHQTDEAVHSHPYTAMGASAVAGLLLGFLLSRR